MNAKCRMSGPGAGAPLGVRRTWPRPIKSNRIRPNRTKSDQTPRTRPAAARGLAYVFSVVGTVRCAVRLRARSWSSARKPFPRMVTARQFVPPASERGRGHRSAMSLPLNGYGSKPLPDQFHFRVGDASRRGISPRVMPAFPRGKGISALGNAGRSCRRLRQPRRRAPSSRLMPAFPRGNRGGARQPARCGQCLSGSNSCRAGLVARKHASALECSARNR